MPWGSFYLPAAVRAGRGSPQAAQPRSWLAGNALAMRVRREACHARARGRVQLVGTLTPTQTQCGRSRAGSRGCSRGCPPAGGADGRAGHCKFRKDLITRTQCRVCVNPNVKTALTRAQHPRLAGWQAGQAPRRHTGRTASEMRRAVAGAARRSSCRCSCCGSGEGYSPPRRPAWRWTGRSAGPAPAPQSGWPSRGQTPAKCTRGRACCSARRSDIVSSCCQHGGQACGIPQQERPAGVLRRHASWHAREAGRPHSRATSRPRSREGWSGSCGDGHGGRAGG